MIKGQIGKMKQTTCLHYVPIKTGKCIKCGTPISDDIISKYRSVKAEIETIADSPDFDYANWYKEAVAIFHPYDSTYYAFAKKCTTSMKIKNHHGQEQSKDIFRKLNMVMSLFAKQAGWVLKSKILAKKTT